MQTRRPDPGHEDRQPPDQIVQVVVEKAVLPGQQQEKLQEERQDKAGQKDSSVPVSFEKNVSDVQFEREPEIPVYPGCRRRHSRQVSEE